MRGKEENPLKRAFLPSPAPPSFFPKRFIFFRLSVCGAKEKRERRSEGRATGGYGTMEEQTAEGGTFFLGAGCGGGKAPDARKTFLRIPGRGAAGNPCRMGGWAGGAPAFGRRKSARPRLFLKTKGRHESRACRTSGGRQTSVRSPPQKKLRNFPAKKILPRATSGNVRKTFFLRCGAALPPRAAPKCDAFRRSFVAVPRRRGTFFRRSFPHRPITKAQRSPRPRLSSEPPFLCASPGTRPAAQVLRLST